MMICFIALPLTPSLAKDLFTKNDDMETKKDAIERIATEIEADLAMLDLKTDILSCYTFDRRYKDGGGTQLKVEELRARLHVAKNVALQIRLMNGK